LKLNDNAVLGFPFVNLRPLHERQNFMVQCMCHISFQKARNFEIDFPIRFGAIHYFLSIN